MHNKPEAPPDEVDWLYKPDEKDHADNSVSRNTFTAEMIGVGGSNIVT